MEKRASPDYILGHSPQEIRRLELQASRIDPITRRFFAAAGVSAGDRVLDVGSGAGDVSFLTKQLVGEGEPFWAWTDRPLPLTRPNDD